MHARFKQPDYLTIGLLFQLSVAHGNRSIKWLVSMMKSKTECLKVKNMDEKLLIKASTKWKEQNVQH